MNAMKRSFGSLIAGFALAIFSGATSAEIFSITSKVERVLLADGIFGGCMARLNPGPETLTGSCSSNYVTLDCANFFEAGRASSSQKVANAQLALVVGNDVYVKFDNARKTNGYCYAARFDVVAVPSGP